MMNTFIIIAVVNGEYDNIDKILLFSGTNRDLVINEARKRFVEIIKRYCQHQEWDNMHERLKIEKIFDGYYEIPDTAYTIFMKEVKLIEVK